MLAKIVYPNFNHPTPPRPCVPFILRVLKRIIAVWKMAMVIEYAGEGKLPTIVPEWWTVDRVLHFAQGGKHEPVFVATIRSCGVVRRNRMEDWNLPLSA
jgi:hypothetical protein